MIRDLEKWEKNVFYVVYEWEGDIYKYAFGTNDNLEVEDYVILPEYYEGDKPIFTDEYKEVAESILNMVVTEFEIL